MMSNLKIYNDVLKKVLEVEEEQLEGVKYQAVPKWDSIGNIDLISELEGAFNIVIDDEDIIGFCDYISGKEMLNKYGVFFE